MKKRRKRTFLHNHPMMEMQLGVDKDHVIVDKKDWEEVKVMIMMNNRIFEKDEKKVTVG